MKTLKATSSSSRARNSRQKRKLKIRLFGGRDIKKCCFCKRELTLRTATLEHILPLSLGGKWNIENLTISCEPCNSHRSSKDYAEFKKLMLPSSYR